MRIFPSWSSRMKPNVGSTERLTISSSRSYMVPAIRVPEGDAGAAHRVDADT